MTQDVKYITLLTEPDPACCKNSLKLHDAAALVNNDLL